MRGRREDREEAKREARRSAGCARSGEGKVGINGNYWDHLVIIRLIGT